MKSIFEILGLRNYVLHGIQSVWLAIRIGTIMVMSYLYIFYNSICACNTVHAFTKHILFAGNLRLRKEWRKCRSKHPKCHIVLVNTFERVNVGFGWEQSCVVWTSRSQRTLQGTVSSSDVFIYFHNNYIMIILYIFMHSNQLIQRPFFPKTGFAVCLGLST